MAVAQAAAPGQDTPAVFRGGTQEILLDFVARDRRHNVVKDLRLEEIEIYEDGVRQTPKSFRYRDGAETRPAPPSVDGSTIDPLREINIVSIVFESMGPETRSRATRLMQEFLNTGIRTNTWIGVFTLSHQLSVLQPYTTDLALLRSAVNRAGTGAYQQFAKENVAIIQKLNSLEAGLRDPARFQPIQPGSAEERGPQVDRLLGPVLIQMNQLTLRTLMQQQGSRSIDALRGLVRQQARLPGRKTVLYVSEGLVVPPQQPELLRSVISEANRGNISFYAIDARGLNTTSSMAIASKTTEAILGADQDTGGPQVMQTDLQQNARELAAGSGGFAMDNSNDLRAPLRRVMEDVRSHYEVTFSPSGIVYDGRFRTLEVKAKRAGVTVQGRRGYFALPMVAGEALMPFEMAALNALAASPVPQAFPYQTAALRFGMGGNGVQYELVFSVPGRALKFAVDDAGTTFSLHVSFVGVIKDEHGEIVQIVRRDLPYRAPFERRAQFEAGEVTATAPVRLSPGHYRLEAVALDREANSASVRRSALTVPAVSSRLPVSDFVWVRSVAPASESYNAADPLESTDGRITPEIHPSFARSDSAAFYFMVRPPAAVASVQPGATITLARDGQVVAGLPVQTPRPDEEGTYRFTGRIPLARLEPGQYELTLTVSLGTIRSEALSLFSVQ